MNYFIIEQTIKPSDIKQLEKKLKAAHIEPTILFTEKESINNIIATRLKNVSAPISFVGSDYFIQNGIEALNNIDISIAFFPLPKSNFLDITGIKNWDEAIKLYVKNEPQAIDLIIINNKPFLSLVEIASNNKPISLTIDDKAQAIIAGDKIFIANTNLIGTTQETVQQGLFDALLDILVIKEQKGFFKKTKNIITSVLHGKKVAIETESPIPITFQNKEVTQTPCVITVKPTAIKLIVAFKKR